MRDSSNPTEYEAIVLIGFQETKERYVAQWTDTYGGEFSAIGYDHAHFSREFRRFAGSNPAILRNQIFRHG